MNQPPNERNRTLLEIDRLLAEATDDAARAELLRLRERLDAPELRDVARELAGGQPRPKGNWNFTTPCCPACSRRPAA
jgi:hypothetical protein